ncbi:universal stress protein [Jiella sonneratiae]|uniref:Universal stress protein n=1 Tax=Jiella sonneratiae TaxID=2816856 RepID=A0ABS3J7C4_9HYPH|nr:universal stress protein [Jiella sonneratiae]MBO0905564.1 universal stress protein [Jiella sonneratiae]
MYRTILVCLDAAERVDRLMDVALPLAARHGAHLVGLHVMPSALADLATEISVDYLEATRRAMRHAATALKAAFDERVARDGGVSAEWRCEEPTSPDYARAVTRHALCADLVVVAQSHTSEWNGGGIVTDVLFETGRPILFVPREGRFAEIGRYPVVAWNGTREAARAAFDALPLLAGADLVRVLSIDPHRGGGREGLAPGDDLAASLARHGLTVETATTYSGEITAGDALLNHLAEVGADLLVMGCYGHSRIREMLFGGVTRKILREMTAPVLMSR